jgi:hypothetical protein
MRSLTAIALVALAALASLAARAEQSIDGAAPYSAAARIDLRVVIPGFLRFRVGSAGATINELTFAPAAATVGSGALIPSTGGDVVGGTRVTVVVQGNNGQITITATNNSGGLGLGTGNPADGYIDYAQFLANSNAPGVLPTPALTNAGGTTALPALSAGKVTDRQARWRFRYRNQTIPSAGTYGTAANGGRVTYTASMP